MADSSSSRLRGIVPAITTSFTHAGGIDQQMLERQVRYLRDGGAHGIFACGGTGEGAYLTMPEKRQVLRVVRDVLGSDGLLCAAVIGPDTESVLRQLTELVDCPVDFVVATAPYYYAMRQSDLVAHFERLAAESFAPLVAYNIPSATHNPMTAETMCALSEVTGIAGIKDSSGDLALLTRALLSEHPTDFAWFVGEDYLCGPALLCGADGVVSGLANARIAPYVQMFAAHERGDGRHVMQAQARINDLYEIIRVTGRGNASIKAATALAGRGTFEMRFRSQTLDESEREAVAEILATFDRTA